ncbi:Uncharacterized protein TCM_005660 isoform 2 [Theobroma cacao]|uniref:Uncharacterized protein isoform 2 n=1 Tax=Theobroma cacao TaxID=3641 RepID=A0A061DVH6_THECC|nr:Uncharacterized protein TCM_005660 isoform 2 [Theobroma cacao]
MAANTDQEIAPLIENNDQPQDLEIDIPKEDYEPAPECCIYKVPSPFREANEKAYTPQLISIGPLHCDNQKLDKMEWKMRTFNQFSSRISPETFGKFQSYIGEHGRQIRRCYGLEFFFNAEFEAFKFEKIILYDAVFIIELLLMHYEEGEIYNLVWRSEWFSTKLRLDLMLLENQLPFFVLEDLYNLAFPVSDHSPSFLDLACSYFYKDPTMYQKGIKHFTDLTRCSLVISRPSIKNKISDDNMYTATMLHEAGVKFEVSNDRLLNVTFEKGVLKIPIFVASYATETICRNVMACEQCDFREEAYFCSYIQLLNSFVVSEKDVDLLIKKNIIVNNFGSHRAVAEMINNLTVELVLPTGLYSEIGRDLNLYYERSWNPTIRTLKHVYFKNIWRGTATIVASIVVLLTLIQTVMAILDRAIPMK